MTRKPLTAMVAAALAALALGLSACGGGDDDAEAPPATTTPPAATATTPATTPTAPASTATTLELQADPDNGLAFVEETLTAPAGEITIVFTNDAALPHNVAVEGPGATDVPSDTVQGGGTAELTETLAAGTYEYYCEVPGHREGGMVGTLTVE